MTQITWSGLQQYKQVVHCYPSHSQQHLLPVRPQHQPLAMAAWAYQGVQHQLKLFSGKHFA
jgi:hypothetical protein